MTAPTPENVRAFMREKNLTGDRVAELIGVNTRTVRRYTSDPEKPNAKQMPKASWSLLRILYGDITADQARSECGVDLTPADDHTQPAIA